MRNIFSKQMYLNVSYLFHVR